MNRPGKKIEQGEGKLDYESHDNFAKKTVEETDFIAVAKTDAQIGCPIFISVPLIKTY